MTVDHAGENRLVQAGIVFTFIICLAFLGVLASQAYFLDSKFLRLQVLSTRLSMFLPTYAILMMFSLAYPSASQALEFPIAVAEGASFYSFFALMITNLGGPEGYIQAVTKLNSSPACCSCLCDGKNHAGRFNRVKQALQAMLTVRLALVLISLICGYKGAKVAHYVFTLLSAAIVAYTIISMIVMFEMILPVSNNFKGVLKLLLMKMTVGMIVFEGIAETFIARVMVKRHGDSAAVLVARIYCLVILVEFAVLSPLYLFVYGSKMQPAPILAAVAELENPDSEKLEKGDLANVDGVVGTSIDGNQVADKSDGRLDQDEITMQIPASSNNVSVATFLCMCFSFFDYWTDPANYLILDS